jgi:hypothetical protein
MLWVHFCFSMVSVIGWIKLSKIPGVVFPRTNLETYLLNLSDLCVYQRIRVAWDFVSWKILIFLSFQSLDGSFLQTMTAFGFPYSKKYIKYGILLSSPLTSGSWIWNGSKATIPFLSIGACFIPHNISSLPVWSSSWIHTLLNFLPMPRLSSFSSSYPLAIADLIHPSTL